MNKTVSIIIPCYNGENFADRCLESIVSQDYPRLEIIVVNDGSSCNIFFGETVPLNIYMPKPE